MRITKDASGFLPDGWRHQAQGNVERLDHADNAAQRVAHAEDAGHALPRHAADLLDHGQRDVVGMEAQ